VENSGVIVTREELRNRLWPTDTYGSFDDGLNTAIRNFVRHSMTRPRHHVSSKRFQSEGTVSSLPLRSSTFRHPQVASHNSRHSASIALGDYSFSRRSYVAASGGLQIALLPKKSSPEFSSLVVLPLEQLSGDATQEYFADGMTDALITDLARFKSLSVISRTSSMRFKGKHLFGKRNRGPAWVDAIVEVQSRVLEPCTDHGAADRCASRPPSLG